MSDFVKTNDMPIEEEPGAKLIRGKNNIDTLTRTYRGDKSYLAQFLFDHRAFVPDEEFGTMVIPNEDGSVNVDYLEGDQVKVDVTYKGVASDFEGNELPPDTESDSLSLQSASLTTDDEDDGTITVQYYSPSTTYSYISRSRPNGPKKSEAKLKTKIELFNPQPAFYAGELQYAIVERLVAFDDSEEGDYWAVTETWARVVVAVMDLPDVE